MNDSWQAASSRWRCWSEPGWRLSKILLLETTRYNVLREHPQRPGMLSNGTALGTSSWGWHPMAGGTQHTWILPSIEVTSRILHGRDGRIGAIWDSVFEEMEREQGHSFECQKASAPRPITWFGVWASVKEKKRFFACTRHATSDIQAGPWELAKINWSVSYEGVRNMKKVWRHPGNWTTLQEHHLCRLLHHTVALQFLQELGIEGACFMRDWWRPMAVGIAELVAKMQSECATQMHAVFTLRWMCAWATI